MATSNNTMGPEMFYKFIDKENVTKSWVLFESPIPMVLVVAAYLPIVLYVGPRLMASRKPYNLKNIMRVYNICQVLYNMCFLYELFTTPSGWTYLWHTSCNHGDPEAYPELRQKFLAYSWHYYVLKVIDLTDTLFMVLGKKNSQITVLHVYHHAAMVVLTWYSNKYIKAQQSTIPVLINTLVHTVMYTYYFLATLGPNVKKHLWWKKYITQMQLTQFLVIIIYLWVLHYNNCFVARDFNIIWILNMSCFTVLFINFYKQTYLKPSQAASLSHQKTS